MSRSAMERSLKRKARMGTLELSADPFTDVDTEIEANETSNSIPIWGNARTMNMDSMLINNIVDSEYFRSLRVLTTFQEVIDEIGKTVEYVEPWAAGTARIPSSAFCNLFKLFCLRLTKKQMMSLLAHKSNPFLRALGFLYLRYATEPKRLWSWFQDYVDDPMEFTPSSNYNATTTMGDWIVRLLGDQKYYGTLLPRLPVPVKRDITVRLALVAEDRLRSDFHRRHVHLFQPGTQVRCRYSEDDEWYDAELGEAIDDSNEVWNVYYSQYDTTEVRTIGQMDFPPSERNACFNESHAGTGASAREMAKRLLEQEKQSAVASNKRQYSHRPASLKGSLSLKLDTYSYRKQGETSIVDQIARVASRHSGSQMHSEERGDEGKRRRRGGRRDELSPSRSRSRSPKRSTADFLAAAVKAKEKELRQQMDGSDTKKDTQDTTAKSSRTASNGRNLGSRSTTERDRSHSRKSRSPYRSRHDYDRNNYRERSSSRYRRSPSSRHRHDTDNTSSHRSSRRDRIYDDRDDECRSSRRDHRYHDRDEEYRSSRRDHRYHEEDEHHSRHRHRSSRRDHRYHEEDDSRQRHRSSRHRRHRSPSSELDLSDHDTSLKDSPTSPVGGPKQSKTSGNLAALIDRYGSSSTFKQKEQSRLRGAALVDEDVLNIGH